MADSAMNMNVIEPIDLATDYLLKNGYTAEGTEITFQAVVPYGSRVYGTASPDSDRDFLVVVESHSLLKEIESEIGIHHLQDSDIEVSLVSTALFAAMMERCEVRVMESIFTPDKLVPLGYAWLQKMREQFTASLAADESQTLNRIRSAFSGVSSNSEVKARKKVRDSEYMIGLKSLFHSVRLLMFGLQLGETGKIEDFEVATGCWDEIVAVLVPKIEDNSLTPGDCKAFYKKWAKTPRDGESKHLLTKFKDCLPKL
jgi:RNA repair pathway DNA polymerase beta family